MNYFWKLPHANSKLDAGRVMLKSLDVEPGELLLIGDTIHDFEVASELGCSCGKNAQKIQSSAGQIDHPPKGLLKDHRQSQIWAFGGVN